MRNVGDTEKRICMILAPRFLRGAFFAAKNPAYWICKSKKKGAKKMQTILGLKKEFIDSGWWDIDERISSDVPARESISVFSSRE